MKFFWRSLATLLVALFAVNAASAQCGNYFKLNYRAVNKLTVFDPWQRQYLLDDWTGDGRLDYWNFRLNSATSANDIVIFPALATGYWDWANPIVYTTAIPGRPHSYDTSENFFLVKDFNSDGRMDLHFNDRTYQNNGSGALTTLAPSNLPFNHSRAGYHDLNGDGLLDVLDRVFSNGVWSLLYYPGNADGSFGAPVTIQAHAEIGGIGAFPVADYNADGRRDVAYAVPQFMGGPGYRVFLNAGNGTFTAGNMIAPATGELYFGEVRDFNNDSRPDILASSPGNKLVVLFGAGDGTFTENAQTFANPLGSAIRIAELNGDSYPDLVGVHENYYTTYINNGGNSGFTQTHYPKTLLTPGAIGSVQYAKLLFADFSGDGKADVLENNGYHFRNAFGEPVAAVKENVCQDFKPVKRMNFDDNRATDYAVWNPSTGEWLSRNNNWNGFDAPKRFTWGSGAHGDIPSPGDFDGDGKTDYAVYRNSTGVWYAYLSASSSWLVLQFGLTGDVPVPNDYDGGGQTDIAVWRPADGNWYIWYMETQSFGALHFGSDGDRPVPSDYDGDGKTDVGVFRPSEGNWYYLKSSDGNFSVYNWGVATDKALPADYDGDGKSDLAIFRDGVWYVWRSAENAPGYLFFGLGTDVPSVSVYNEITANPVVFRSTQTAFYSRLSPTVSFPGSGNVPVYFGLPNN